MREVNLSGRSKLSIGELFAAATAIIGHLAAEEIDEAEKYVSALVTLIPDNIALLDAALSCNLALGRPAEACEYAATILSLDPAHRLARSTIQSRREQFRSFNGPAPRWPYSDRRQPVVQHELEGASSSRYPHEIDDIFASRDIS